jgi:hypothetical protein
MKLFFLLIVSAVVLAFFTSSIEAKGFTLFSDIEDNENLQASTTNSASTSTKASTTSSTDADTPRAATPGVAEITPAAPRPLFNKAQVSEILRMSKRMHDQIKEEAKTLIETETKKMTREIITKAVKNAAKKKFDAIAAKIDQVSGGIDNTYDRVQDTANLIKDNLRSVNKKVKQSMVHVEGVKGDIKEVSKDLKAAENHLNDFEKINPLNSIHDNDQKPTTSNKSNARDTSLLIQY